MTVSDITRTLPIDVRRLAEICRQNDVTRLRIFGSMARGEATATSDVDLLIEFSEPKSLRWLPWSGECLRHWGATLIS